MTLGGVAARGAAVATLVAGLLAVEPASVRASGPERGASSAARTGAVAVTIRTPAGVPGVVVLKSGGRVRTVTKRAAGRQATVRVRLPEGRWTVTPQRVVARRTIFAGLASRTTLVVRGRGTAATTVTYRAAPAVRSLRVADLRTDRVSLAWGAPERGASYVVRRAVGTKPPSSPGMGTAVPVVGTTATATRLRAATDYAFAVFARRRGTGTWGKAVTLRVTTPSPTGPAVVTNPAAVLVDGEAPVAVEVTPEGVVAQVPAGVVPTPGQPWVLPISADLPGGFVGTVSAVSPDGTSVTLTPGGLADAFDYLEIRAPDLSTIPLNTPGSSRRAAVDLDCDTEGPTPDLDPQVSIDPFGHFNATLKKKEIDWAPDIPLGMSFDARFGVDVEASFSASVSASASCTVSLPPLSLTLPAGPVPILLMLEPRGTLSISGEVAIENIGFTARLGASAEGYLGAGGEDVFEGDLIADAEPLTPTVETSGSATLQVGAGVSVGPGLGLSGVAGATVGVEADLNAVDAAITPGFGEGCLEVKAGRSVSVSITAKAWLGSWDAERSVEIPGLSGYADYGGSPWYFPDGCGGPSDYRIASGTLAVSHSWSVVCENDLGWPCDDGPDSTSTDRVEESSDARLVVAEPGEWSRQFGDAPADLDAPLRFQSWDFSTSYVETWTNYACHGTNRDESTGPVEFGDAYWRTSAKLSPAPGLMIDLYLVDRSVDWPDFAEWTPYIVGEFGALDTDLSNGYPRIAMRTTRTYGGECEGGTEDNWSRSIERLGPGGGWWMMSEARRTAADLTVTRLGTCGTVCQFRVDGVETYEFRSRVEDFGYGGDGALTMTWSYVIERRPHQGD